MTNYLKQALQEAITANNAQVSAFAVTRASLNNEVTTLAANLATKQAALASLDQTILDYQTKAIELQNLLPVETQNG